MMEYIFGGASIEKVLFYLLVNQKYYPSELRRVFDQPVNTFQKASARLERGGVIVGHLEGKTVVYRFNPRYPFLNELVAFLQKAYSFLPVEIREKYYETMARTRPRRRGKPL